MKAQLLAEDARAIDILLDRGAQASTPQSVPLSFTQVFTDSDAALRERVRAAQTILHLLDAFDPADPPADLVARTVHAVAKVAMVPVGTRQMPIAPPHQGQLA